MLVEESKKYFESLRSGESTRCKALIRDCLKKKFSVFEIYENIFVPALKKIGDQWLAGEISISQEHRATQIVLDEMRRLRDQIQIKEDNGRKMAACALSGDLHSIGARMVADYFLEDGWAVEFLGADLPVSELINFIIKEKPDAVTISISNESSLPQLTNLSNELKKLTNPPLVQVGGKASINLDNFENISKCNTPLDCIKIARDFCNVEYKSLSFPELLVSLGSEIQRKRKQKRFSQKQLAEKANIDRAYLSQVENGKKNLSLSALYRLSRALELSTVTLLKAEKHR